MRIKGRHIVDEKGRTLILRGVNLGGSSKQPFGPPGQGLEAESLRRPEAVSFAGRPFPLEEADAHFERLVRGGLTFVRLVVTWEALEHQGPGIYDEAYLAYLRKLLLGAEKWGISVYVDPHQDVWSRWTGGDGAPAWTLEKLGMDLDALDATGSAVTRQRYGEFHRGKAMPRMSWPGNYNRYAAATLFTLFFGGNTYAPRCTIDGEGAQDWLQERYIAAFRHCYRRLKHCGAIAGWGTMNEPHHGFIGHRNLEVPENPVIPLGPMPSPFQTMAAAAGFPVKIPVLLFGLGDRGLKTHEVLNPQGRSLFREGFECPWKREGVWTAEGGTPRLLKGDHFAGYRGGRAGFTNDFLKPFMIRFINRMKEVNERSFFFIEGVPRGAHPSWGREDPANTVNAFHYYDGFTLYMKRFRPWFTVRTDTWRPVFGRKRVAAWFVRAPVEGIAWTREHMGDMPCLLGEFGLPFDMNRRKGLKTGDYSVHEEALSMYYDAIDANLLHSTIWNYTADNTHAAGDGWNDEDLSIFSEGKERAAGGWRRPYPMATAGIPLEYRWDRKKGVFRFRYMAESGIEGPTEIFAPPECFGTTPEVEIRSPSGAAAEWKYESEKRRIFVTAPDHTGVVEVTVTRRNLT
ncbi:MAG: cellulase family glycosylhydrolase [Treponema sp.]|nr:cellulase family glycosylhydrolase [Treponema sp.]